MEVELVAKKWGSSLGIVLPKTLVEKEHIGENDVIVVEIKKRHFAREFFGILSGWRKPTDTIKEEMKKGW